MSDSFPIDEVVRRTGLTSRALRFYEARGLITPLRTGSGRRWFGPQELERIQRIVALKKAGLRPGGKVPEASAKEYGELPPVAVSVWL